MYIEKCPFCGLEMNYDTSVCQYKGCGATLPENARYCPQCAGQVDEDVICPRCRGVIEEADLLHVATLSESEREVRYARGIQKAKQRSEAQEEFFRKLEEVAERRRVRERRIISDSYELGHS